MLSKKRKLPSYPDGLVYIYREKKDRKTTFGAKENPEEVPDMDFVVKLAFAEQSKRVQDLDFAEQRNFELSTKIKTQLRNEVDSTCRATIGNNLFDISYIDKSSTEMWLYLSGVRKIDT